MTPQEYEVRFRHHLAKTRSGKLAQALCAADRNEYVTCQHPSKWQAARKELEDIEHKAITEIIGITDPSTCW